MGRFVHESSGGNFTPPPVGTHVARCFKLVDIGTQHGEYQGKPTTRVQHLAFFELPNELVQTDEGERPAIATKFYTTSMNEKAAWRNDLEGWRGQAFTDEDLAQFDNEQMLGCPCMLSIVATTKSDGTKGAKIASVVALPKGMECPPQVNKSFSFWMDDFDEDEFNKLSDGIKKLIMRSDEYAAIKLRGAGKP